MPVAKPPKDFARSVLDIATIPAGATWLRLYRSAYPDPLGYGMQASRFSHPSRKVSAAKYFGILYLGATLKVCFLETILRDNANGQIGDFPIAESELTERRCAEIVVREELRLVDLRSDGPARMRIPSDVVRASAQRPGRLWSLALHSHPAAVDGLIYPSRLNGDTNLAIYDRALRKLEVGSIGRLIDRPEFPAILRDFRIALV